VHTTSIRIGDTYKTAKQKVLWSAIVEAIIKKRGREKGGKGEGEKEKRKG
jgi:hypothetical protein